MMETLLADDIPNIRFNIAKSYAVLIDVLKKLPEEGTILSLEKAGRPYTASPKSQALIQSAILPNLEKLQQDDDVDVRYFATTAASSASDIMQTS
jgi:serine/threonine-protein phosphatase 2A regulatory subunit A